jgi:peptide/nickel transport system ATP-binding protein
VEKGPSKAVFSPPFHPYTKLLLSSVPEMRQGWLEGVADTGEAKAASAGSVIIGAKGCPFANRCAHVIAGTCDRVTPPLHELPGGLSVACHLDADALPGT